MNLLTEGIVSGVVIKTELTRKLTIDGITGTYPVYKVRLDMLFYNDQNDRIATWISNYKAENNGTFVNLNNRNEYNNVIEEFIIKSNIEAFNRTKNNIEIVNQREPGVVLVDGRIIDGNRRFACLRKLALKNDKFNYFETAILDKDIKNSEKQIKMLELYIQHGEEGKTEYSPIERLVGIYNDVIKNKLLSVEEYSRATNEVLSEVKERVEIANLMMEFLDFINAPLQFHIARDMQIHAPIEALLKLLKKCSTNDEREDLKTCVFTNLLMRSEGDMRQFVNNHIKSIIGSDYQESFIEEQKEISEKVINLLPPEGQITYKIIRDQIRSIDEIVQELDHSLDKVITKVKKTKTRNLPIQLIEKATDILEDIDFNIIANKLNDTELQRIKRQFNKLESIVKEIRNSLND